MHITSMERTDLVEGQVKCYKPAEILTLCYFSGTALVTLLPSRRSRGVCTLFLLSFSETMCCRTSMKEVEPYFNSHFNQIYCMCSQVTEFSICQMISGLHTTEVLEEFLHTSEQIGFF